MSRLRRKIILTQKSMGVVVLKNALSLIVITLLISACQRSDRFETDVTQYIDLPREERILRTLSDEGYNGEDALDMHFSFFAEDVKSAELLAASLAEQEAYSRVRTINFPTHKIAAVLGEAAPIVVNRESLSGFSERLESFANNPSISVASWGTQTYMAPRQDVDWEKLKRKNKIKEVRDAFKLMNKRFSGLLDKVKNADVNAGNAEDFRKDIEKKAREVLGWKIEVLNLLPKFYKNDFSDWYDNIVMVCHELNELSDAIRLPPTPNDAAAFDAWKDDVDSTLEFLELFIEELQEMLQTAIDAFSAPDDEGNPPPPNDGIPHPLEAHLMDLKAQLERKKQMVGQVKALFAPNADPAFADPARVQELIDKCRAEKEWFIADLTYIFGEQFPIFGITFYEWFHTLKGLDDALDPIIFFKFRDPNDAKKTKADLVRLEQAIQQAKAWKEIMEKWKLR